MSTAFMHNILFLLYIAFSNPFIFGVTFTVFFVYMNKHLLHFSLNRDKLKVFNLLREALKKKNHKKWKKIHNFLDPPPLG